MIVRFAKSNNSAALVLLPLIAIVIWIFGFISSSFVPVNGTMPFYELIARPLALIPWLNTFIALALVVLEAFILNYIVNENDAVSKKSYLPALLYIVFMSCDMALLTLHPLIFSNLFLLFAVSKIFHSYRKDIAFSQVFDAGFLISLGSLFYFPSVIFLPVIGIGILLFRPFLWREWAIFIIGALTPYVFIFTYFFWNDSLDYIWQKMSFPVFFQKPALDGPGSFYFLAGVIGVILLLSYSNLFNGLSGGAQKTKKALILMIWLSVPALVPIFIASQFSMIYFSAIAIPASVICSNYFLRQKKEWYGEVLFFLLIIAIFTTFLTNIF